MRPSPTWLLGPLLFALGGCASDIDLPRPEELKVKQIAYGARGAVELSWKQVLRVDGYLLHYDHDSSAPPYSGRDLLLVRWFDGCGDFDGGALGAASSTLTAADLGIAGEATPHDAGLPDGHGPDAARADGAVARDSRGEGSGPRDAHPDDALPPDQPWPGYNASSPIRIPVAWCLDREQTYSDAGFAPVETPGARPRVRLAGLVAGQTYHFAVQAFRRQGIGPLSEPASIAVLLRRP